MKLVTKLTVVATLATFMFAGINLTWGNAYSDSATGLAADDSWGVWLDVNDSSAFGWENGQLMVGFAGPAGMTVRLGFDPTEAVAASVQTSLGMSNTWWTSTGDGWGTNLSTAIDWNMTGTDAETGAFTLTMAIGFGF